MGWGGRRIAPVTRDRAAQETASAVAATAGAALTAAVHRPRPQRTGQEGVCVGVALRGRRAATRCPSVARDPSASLRLLLPLGEFFKPRALPLYLRSALPCWARSRSLARSPAAAPRPQRELSGLARPCDTTAARTASPRKPKARREARAPARDAKWTPSGAPRVPRDHHARVKRTSREEWEVLRQGGHSASRAVREVERPGRPPVVSSSPLPARLRGREPFASRFAAEARPSSHSAAGGQTRWQRCRKQLLQPLVGRRLKAVPRPPPRRSRS